MTRPTDEEESTYEATEADVLVRVRERKGGGWRYQVITDGGKVAAVDLTYADAPHMRSLARHLAGAVVDARRIVELALEWRVATQLAGPVDNKAGWDAAAAVVVRLNDALDQWTLGDDPDAKR